ASSALPRSPHSANDSRTRASPWTCTNSSNAVHCLALTTTSGQLALSAPYTSPPRRRLSRWYGKFAGSRKDKDSLNRNDSGATRDGRQRGGAALMALRWWAFAWLLGGQLGVGGDVVAPFGGRGDHRRVAELDDEVPGQADGGPAEEHVRQRPVRPG